VASARSPVRLLSATNVLVAINVLLYIWEQTTGAFTSNQALVDHGAIYGPLVTQGQWWRVVTGAFLHGGLLHVSLNMFALFQVGTFLEMLVGPRRMLITYVISLVGSGVAVVLFNYNQVTVGASGAIFGIFGALVAIGLRLGPRGRGLVQQTLPIILINLAIGFSVPNISSVGHLGGLISGFVAGLALIMLHQTPSQAAEAADAPEVPLAVEEVSPAAALDEAEADAETDAESQAESESLPSQQSRDA
jgi:rhomboid protease GluP